MNLPFSAFRTNCFTSPMYVSDGYRKKPPLWPITERKPSLFLTTKSTKHQLRTSLECRSTRNNMEFAGCVIPELRGLDWSSTLKLCYYCAADKTRGFRTTVCPQALPYAHETFCASQGYLVLAAHRNSRPCCRILMCAVSLGFRVLGGIIIS